MNLDSIVWGLSIAGFSSIGAYFLVQTLVKSGIEKAVEHNFSKKLEGQKTSLKKSEVYFTQQLEALSHLRTLLRKMLPRRSDPDMEWEEACEGIAKGFSKHEEVLEEFLCRYEAVLPKTVSSEVQNAISRASDGTFEFVWNSQRKDVEPTSAAIKSAGALYEYVQSAIEHLQAHVDLQVGAN
jgi:hypothetical protein